MNRLQKVSGETEETSEGSSGKSDEAVGSVGGEGRWDWGGRDSGSSGSDSG